MIHKGIDKTPRDHHRIVFYCRCADKIKYDRFKMLTHSLKTEVPDFHLKGITGHQFTGTIIIFSEIIENMKTTAYLYAVKLSPWSKPVV